LLIVLLHLGQSITHGLVRRRASILPQHGQRGSTSTAVGSSEARVACTVRGMMTTATLLKA
jgi:hypothetical protein